MSVDRPAALRAADKLLRLGKLQPAIAEYARLVLDDPRDWESALFLATLHLRGRDVDAAIAQLTTVADTMSLDGEVARAAAVYRRILAARPDDEHALRQAAVLAVNAGNAGEARGYLLRLAEQQLSRGDSAGVAATLAEAVEIDPDHAPTLAQLARLLVMQGNAAAAAEHLTPAMAGADPDARMAAVEIFLRGGKSDAALELAGQTLTDAPEAADRIVRLACMAAPHVPDAAFALVELAVQRWTADSDCVAAAAALEQFVASAPACIDALVRLVDVAVDGELGSIASHAQEMLADAYLAAGAIEEGLAIAEDLAAREPENEAHAARLRQAHQAPILQFRVSAAS